jgi:hypothetical protein
MEYGQAATEEYLVVSIKTKVAAGVEVAKAIQANFEILQREFPKLNIKQTGPVLLIYHLKGDSHGAPAGIPNVVPTTEYALETAYPIGRGKLIRIDPRSKLVNRELKKSKCARYLFKGPVWDAPWGDFITAVKADGVRHIKEIREVYRVFKGGASPDNEIELQIILE